MTQDATPGHVNLYMPIDTSALQNKLNLTSKQDIDDAEAELLFELYKHVFKQPLKTLTFHHVLQWHQQWLGNLYDWAGQLRSVNVSKDEFQFAAAAQLPRLSKQFELDFLKPFGQLREMPKGQIVRFLAESHVELVLIHPFRDGNGRLSRLLLDVMAAEAGGAPLDYGLWVENKEFYFKAIQAGASGDYSHIERLIHDVIEL